MTARQMTKLLTAAAIVGGAIWSSGVSAQSTCLPELGCVWPGDIPREEKEFLDQLAIIQQQAQQRPPPPDKAIPGPTIGSDYRALITNWLETHKRYPAAARQRGEQGTAVLRFRIDRSGRVLDYSLASSTGYPDLDTAIEAMMRGVTMPPFPQNMTGPEISVSVRVRFGLQTGTGTPDSQTLQQGQRPVPLAPNHAAELAAGADPREIAEDELAKQHFKQAIHCPPWDAKHPGRCDGVQDGPEVWRAEQQASQRMTDEMRGAHLRACQLGYAMPGSC